MVLTQFGSADSKSAPCQAKFCVFLTQNSKTKWPPKLMKMSQHYIKAWLTMNIKHHFGVLKPTWATYLKSPGFHLVCLPLEDKIQNGCHCKAMYNNFAAKLRRDVFLVSTYRFLTPGKPIPSSDNIDYLYFTLLWGKKQMLRKENETS